MAPARAQQGRETKLARQGHTSSWTKLWRGPNRTTAASDTLPMPVNSTASLDPGPSSGLGEDKAGLLLQWMELSHLVKDETLGTWGQSFVLAWAPKKSY